MCMCDGVLFSHKKEVNPAIVTTWMDLEDILLSEFSQTKTKYCTILICGILLKEQNLTHRKEVG